MVSSAEMKHLSKMANMIRDSGGMEKDTLVLKSDISIAWAEKLCKYIPILFTDIKFDKKHRQFIIQKQITSFQAEEMK